MQVTKTLMPNFAEYSGWAVAIVTGGWALVQAWQAGFSKTEKLKDKASSELIELLQKTVDALKNEVGDLQKAHLENVKEISRMRGENETLTKILQGRDDATVRFQQEGFKAYQAIYQNGEALVKMVMLLEKHFEQSEEFMKNAKNA